jgi:translation elongation factor EF-1beta
MKALEESVRSISQDGLVWGSSTLIPVGFGIKKLQITLVVEDDKVSLEELQEQIEEFEDFVQSTDIVQPPFFSILILGCHGQVVSFHIASSLPVAY